jgi:hypothetical protein
VPLEVALDPEEYKRRLRAEDREATNSTAPASRVKIFPAVRPNFGLRNCVKVACMSPVLGSSGSGKSVVMFTGTSAPESWEILSPKVLPA